MKRPSRTHTAPALSTATASSGKRIANSPFDRFSTTLSLVCRWPIVWPFRYAPEAIAYYLPGIGCLAGATFVLPAGATWFLTRDAAAAALVGLLCQYLGFNLFHLDGLLDTADAFLGRHPPDQRRAILKDPRLGTYALFVGFVGLAAKLLLTTRLIGHCGALPGSFRLIGGTAEAAAEAAAGALAGAQAGTAGLFVFLAGLLSYPIAGRAAAAILPCLLRGDRDDGLGALMKPATIRQAATGAILALAFQALLTTIGLGFGIKFGGWNWSAPTVVVFSSWLWFPISAITGAAAVAALYRRGLGGYTGDALGAAVEIAELLQLLPILLVA